MKTEILLPEKLRRADHRLKLFVAGVILILGSTVAGKVAVDYLVTVTEPQPQPFITQEAPKIVYVLATAAASLTATATETATPKPTETPRRVTATKPSVKPTLKADHSPTPRPEIRPTAAWSGKSLEEAIPATQGQEYTIPAHSRLWLSVGQPDQNKIDLGINIISAGGLIDKNDTGGFAVKIYDDQKFNAVFQFEKGLAEKLPNPVGAASPKPAQNFDRLYSGGHGEGKPWAADVENNTDRPITFRIDLLSAKPGACNAENSGAYWETLNNVMVYWVTCDQNWLGKNK